MLSSGLTKLKTRLKAKKNANPRIWKMIIIAYKQNRLIRNNILIISPTWLRKSTVKPSPTSWPGPIGTSASQKSRVRRHRRAVQRLSRTAARPSMRRAPGCSRIASQRCGWSIFRSSRWAAGGPCLSSSCSKTDTNIYLFLHVSYQLFLILFALLL